jgi:hypothetical protein
MKTYLFIDDTQYQCKIEATSLRNAIAKVRQWQGIHGRIVIINRYSRTKTWREVGSGYWFSLSEII